MTLSMVLAWIAVVCVIGTAWKYIARIGKSVKLNRMFHKIHIPMGVVLIITGLIHGLLAGNFMDTTFIKCKVRDGNLHAELGYRLFCCIHFTGNFLFMPQNMQEKLDADSSDSNGLYVDTCYRSYCRCGDSVAIPHTDSGEGLHGYSG